LKFEVGTTGGKPEKGWNGLSRLGKPFDSCHQGLHHLLRRDLAATGRVLA
jgi:hypothetical protein